jgi:spore maturation protein CgeB
VSDDFEGLDQFFRPASEIIVARTTEDVIAAMQLPQDELARIAQAGRKRVLTSHTAAHRAAELERAFEASLSVPVMNGFTRQHMVAEA